MYFDAKNHKKSAENQKGGYRRQAETTDIRSRWDQQYFEVNLESKPGNVVLSM